MSEVGIRSKGWRPEVSKALLSVSTGNEDEGGGDSVGTGGDSVGTVMEKITC
ncbi:hypothetical protein MA16_Dca006633 [Dendrobium catenatum]|uniref:Uncharacterized protein n=1 Tax=Dendrobium catenatum TaxID=906689 RepID=A0A2I0X5Q9_9ASPA|nr:hypothetical protein MA16_Dca006633 [Dendrobium catenatum]